MKRFKFSSRKTRLSILMSLLAILPTITVGWVAYDLMLENIRSEQIKTVGLVASSKHDQLVLLLAQANIRAELFLSNLVNQCDDNATRVNQVCALKLISSYLDSEGAMGATLYGKGATEGVTIGAVAPRKEGNRAFQFGQLARFSGAGPQQNQSYVISVTEYVTGLGLEITYPSSNLQPVFDHPLELGESGETFLADNEGYFVTSPRFASTQQRLLPGSSSPMQSCLGGKSGEALDLDYRNRPVIHGFRQVPELGSACIMAHIDQAEAFSPLKRLQKNLVLVALLFLLALLLIALYMARRIAETEESLLEQETIYRRVIETSMDGFWVLDIEGRLLEVNDAYVRSSGYSREELLTMRVPDVEYMETPEETAAHIQKVLRDGHDRFESMHITKSGSVWPVEIVVTSRAINGGQFFVFLRDITERKRAEHALLAAKVEAERASNAKSRFLAAASHDLRQPLSALTLYIDVLKNRLTPHDSPLLGSIQYCIDSLSELLINLLDLSKLDAGVITPSLSDFSVAELLDKLCSAHLPEAQQKGLTLRCVPTTLIGHTDAVLFGRLLGNLIANAVRYTERGGVLVGCRRHQGRRWIEVWDSGIGIPEEKTSEIFEEFRQLGNEERNREKGSGLGLAIVAKTAALLGLQIRVRSWPGKGSLFAVELPLGHEMASPVADEKITRQPLRIALVEDDAGVRAALLFALEDAGHQVVAAATSREILALLDSAAPDVVISDYRLASGETGFDAIAALRAAFGSSLPAVLITGDTDPELMRRMASQGVQVQHKPLKLEVLEACIAELASGAKS